MAILLAVSFVANELLRKKPKIENARPGGLGDIKAPTATQDRKVPILWGTCPIDAPNVAWYGDFRTESITTKVKTGMFSSKKVVVGYRYFLGLQLGVCRGMGGVTLLEVQVDRKVVFSGAQSTEGDISINKPLLFGGDEQGAGGLIGTLRWFIGTDAQTASGYLSSFQGGADTPSYVGAAYAVFRGTDGGGYIGNNTFIPPWRFLCRRIPNGLSLGTPTVNGGNDANLMNVLYEILTHEEFDIGLDAADIDIPNFQAAAATLLAEGNGFSMLLDSGIEVPDLIEEIERQANGFLVMNHATGKYQFKLARNDYTISAQPLINKDTLIELKSFDRGDWADTTNVVWVHFNNRTNDYQPDAASAQDMANMQMQGGGTVLTVKAVSTDTSYPGVKNATLANAIAWRNLRAVSFPLAKASFVVDRSFWDVTRGMVVAFTDENLGITLMPMRVLRIDYGELRDGRITLDCVQDVFQWGAGSFGDPPDTDWGDLDTDVDPFPVDEQKAFEAPRGFVWRDPELTSIVDKIWASARKGGPEGSFEIWERHASGAPSGDFTEVGEVFSFAKIGSLKVALSSGTAIPTTSILIEASPDSQTALEAAFTDNPDLVDQGTYLLNLVMVDEEFWLVRSAAVSGADINLQNVYRGVLDSAQASHSAGADVWLIFLGGGLGQGTIPSGQNVEVKLLPKSTTDEVLIGDATAIAFTMDKRLKRPYPPSRLSLNNVIFNLGTVSLDFLASGAAETTGIDTDFVRRDYRTGEARDEIAALSTDAPNIFTDFPTANTTTIEIQVRNDPAGANTLLFTETGIAVATKDILRIKILRYTDGAIPSRMRMVLSSRHNEGPDTGLASRQSLSFDFDTASTALQGKFNFGARTTNTASNVYTATVNGTHSFTLSSAYGGSDDVEYRLNAGAWTTLISAGNTTGNIVGVIATDTIELRHTSAVPGVLKQLDMDAPGAAQDGYMVLYA